MTVTVFNQIVSPLVWKVSPSGRKGVLLCQNLKILTRNLEILTRNLKILT